jgi:hypothetical protein
MEAPYGTVVAIIREAFTDHSLGRHKERFMRDISKLSVIARQRRHRARSERTTS